MKGSEIVGNIAQDAGKGKGKGKPKRTLTSPDAGSKIGWDVVDSGDLKDIICVVTEHGGAVMFGRGRHGDVLSIRVYHDTLETKTQWAANEDEVGDEFHTIDAYFRGLD